MLPRYTQFSENIHFPVTWFELLAETIMIRNILIKLFNLSVLMDNQSNRHEADFDFGSESDQSKEESKSKHGQSYEDLVETLSIKELQAILGLMIKLSLI